MQRLSKNCKDLLQLAQTCMALEEICVMLLSKAFTASHSEWERTKKVKFDLTPLASSTMHVNTLRPRITIVTSFVWA